jgi:hypothetical protein
MQLIALSVFPIYLDMAGPSEDNVVKSIIRGIFPSVARAARVLEVSERHIFNRMSLGILSRRQLRVAATHGRRLAVKLHVQMGPHYSPAYRERAAARRARCLSAVAKAEAMLTGMKTPATASLIEPGHEC